jgi:O-antigen ligase
MNKFFIAPIYIIFLISLGLSTHLLLDFEVVELMSEIKLVLAIILFLLLVISTLKETRKISVQSVLLLLLFPMYQVLVSFLYKDDIDIVLLISHIMWISIALILIPISIRRIKNYNAIFLISLIAVFMVIILGYILSYNEGSYSMLSLGRFTLGYENPNYFAQFLQIGIVSVTFLYLNNHKKNKFILFLLLFLLLILLSASESRNVLSFIVTFFFFMLIKKNAIRKIFYFLIFIVTFVILLLASERSDIDKLSSGRITYWHELTDAVHSQAELTPILGQKRHVEVNSVQWYGRLSEVQSDARKIQHADNMYLEVYLTTGVVGLIFLLFTFIYPVLKSKKYFGSEFLSRFLTSVLISYLIQAFFITNLLSLFSPASIFFVIIYGIYIAESRKELP